MDVIADTSFSLYANEDHIRCPATPGHSLDQLVLLLEDAAFRLLEHENHAYMAGDFEEVMKFAKWRNEIRFSADALCMTPKGHQATRPDRWRILARSIGVMKAASGLSQRSTR